MINREIVQRLIKVGQTIDADTSAPDLTSLRRSSQINSTWHSWKGEVSELDNLCLKHLLKGIVYTEKELNWMGGSVASGIFLFQVLLSRDLPEKEIDEVSSWMISNTKNPYIPFGTSVSLGARNYSEYQKLSSQRRKLIKQAADYDKEHELGAAKQREDRKKRRAHSSGLRNTAVRAKMIQELNGMSIRDQLVQIAEDNTNAPTYYPTKCADSADLSVIESLKPETQLALAMKLKGKHRGPWGAFKKRLLSVCGPISDKQPWNI